MQTAIRLRKTAQAEGLVTLAPVDERGPGAVEEVRVSVKEGGEAFWGASAEDGVEFEVTVARRT